MKRRVIDAVVLVGAAILIIILVHFCSVISQGAL